ncbi:MAG: heme-degrading domain-containing protein [Micrococcales bacterium]
MTAKFNEDLEKTRVHEDRLIFESFDQSDAWALGCQLRKAAEAQGASVTIEICRGQDVWFATSMPGTTSANADWARRKRNLVNLLETSSYAVGLNQKLGSDLPAQMGLSQRDFASHGGCFPVRVRGTGMVGTVTVSGLPQRDDHFLVIREIAKYLGVDLGQAQL